MVDRRTRRGVLDEWSTDGQTGARRVVDEGAPKIFARDEGTSEITVDRWTIQQRFSTKRFLASAIVLGHSFFPFFCSDFF